MQTTHTKLEHVETALRRWHSKLTRASNMIRKLEAKRRRLLLAPKPTVKTKPVEAKPVPPASSVPPVAAPVIEADAMKIPKFLSRNPDEGTAIAATKAAVDKTKMPLTGKEAKAAILAASAKVTARRAKKELRLRP